MEPTSYKGDSEVGPPETTGTRLFESPDGFVAFTRQHYASANANPQRLGCPGDELLRRTARSDQLPDPSVRAHVLKCSECFRVFQTELASYEAALTGECPSYRAQAARSVRLKPAPALGGLLTLLLLLLAGLYVAGKYF
jgi:hypothetical protein